MAAENPLEFKGVSLQLINALLRSTDPRVLAEALREMSGGATDFFSGEPVVLDLSQAGELPATVDWPAILALLRSYQLQPIGVRGEVVAAAGLAMLGEHFFGRPRSSAPPPAAAPAAPPAVPEPAPAAVPAPAEPEPPVQAEMFPATPPRTLVIEKPLRSGQRVYAQGGDLIVLAMVSAGAEVIADGNIHVYAPLRGRALAGAGGDRTARIFTTCLQAELVSVAGIYRTFESGLPADLSGKPAKIGLVETAGDLSLKVEALPIR